MSWLKRVLGAITNLIRPAGLVSREPTTPPSKKRIAQDTPRQSKQQSSPIAQTQPKRKPDRVELTKLGVRSGSVRALAQLQEQKTQAGTKKAAPASQRRQPASRQPKRG